MLLRANSIGPLTMRLQEFETLPQLATWRLTMKHVRLADTYQSHRRVRLQVYTSLNGSKVALWAFSFGPQYALSFLHRMTQASG